MEIFPPAKVKIARIKGKGRGVVATGKIKKGEVIEICPIVYLSEKERSFIEMQSDTLRYYYLRDKKADKICIMLGFGSLYNHDFNANADFETDRDVNSDSLIIRAVRDMNENEEIVIDYKFKNNIVDFLNLQ